MADIERLASRAVEPIILPNEDCKVEEWVEWLRNQKFDTVIITRFPSVPQIIAGFILTKVGIVFAEEDPFHLEIPPELQQKQYPFYITSLEGYDTGRNLWTDGIPLFDRRVTNPSVLSKLIGLSNLDGTAKNKLIILANHLSPYRKYPDRGWKNASNDIQDHKKFPHRRLLELLAVTLCTHIEEVDASYKECYSLLENFLDCPKSSLQEFLIRETIKHLDLVGEKAEKDEPIEFQPFSPVRVTTPIIKSRGDEPDRIEDKNFYFERSQITNLIDTHLGIIIIGSPNSGKSTFASSLWTTMSFLINDCEEAGIIAKDQLKLALCDLDFTSPTAIKILREQPVQRDHKLNWDNLNLVRRADDLFRQTKRKNNITIADMPGGKPDIVTYILGGRAEYSIWIERDYGVSAEPWKKYVSTLGYQHRTNIIHAHTLLGDNERSSGIREYQSLQNGDRKNFIKGRIVNLERELKPTDPFIFFTACALLFDFLPSLVSRAIEEEIKLLKIATGENIDERSTP